MSPIVVNYFWKELHKRCFTGLQTSLCSLNKKFSCKNFFWKVKKSCLWSTCATNYKWTLRKLNPSTLFLPVFLLFHCTKIMFCRKDFLSKFGHIYRRNPWCQNFILYVVFFLRENLAISPNFLSFLRICSYLIMKSLTGNLFFAQFTGKTRYSKWGNIEQKNYFNFYYALRKTQILYTKEVCFIQYIFSFLFPQSLYIIVKQVKKVPTGFIFLSDYPISCRWPISIPPHPPAENIRKPEVL